MSNKYSEENQRIVKEALNDSRVKIYMTDDLKGSNEKLKYLGEDSDYYIALCDDDCIYGDGYFAYLIKGCEFYGGHVSLHGVILKKGLIQSYYHDRMVFRGLGEVKKNVEVDITASCMTLFKRHWYTDLADWYDKVSEISMDDIYISYFAKKKGIRRYVLNHPEGFVTHKVQYESDNYVFDKYKNNDEFQTMFINSFFKKL